MSIGDVESKTQERVICFFKDPEILGYQYIGNLSDQQNKNIKEDRLRQYLRLKGYADKLIDGHTEVFSYPDDLVKGEAFLVSEAQSLTDIGLRHAENIREFLLGYAIILHQLGDIPNEYISIAKRHIRNPLLE